MTHSPVPSTLTSDSFVDVPASVALSDRQLRYERRIKLRDDTSRAHSDPLPRAMTTIVTTTERPFTATQQRNLRQSADPEFRPDPPASPPANPLPGGPPGDPPGDPPAGPNGPGDPPGDPPGGPPPGSPPGDPADVPDDETPPPDPEITNNELREAFIALAKDKKKRKTPFKPREPDVFTGGSPQLLRTFVFQCQVHFNARQSEFTDDTDRIYFAISYLKGPALDYFEPFINEPEPDEVYDFLFQWTAFVQKLNNQFGSYSPEDDNEDSIHSITFPDNTKATRYFIEFSKYQKRVKMDDRSLRRIVKSAIPMRIVDELPYFREDYSTFAGIKKAVMKIDNDYWKRKQDDETKRRVYQNLQTQLSKSTSRSESKSESKRPANPPRSNNPSTSSPLHNSSSSTFVRPRPKPNAPKPFKAHSYASTSTSTPSSSSNLPRPEHIGPDGKLTPAERKRRRERGLCFLCGQKGHLLGDCPKASKYTNTSPNPKARATRVEPEVELARPKD
jgi:hypothetical protein